MTWLEGRVGENSAAAGCGGGRGSVGLETERPARRQILWPKWRESCHSVIHSVIHSLVLGTSVRPCLGIGKTAENKMKSLLPWSVYSNASVIGVSPHRPPSPSSALPAWKTNTRPSVPPQPPGATMSYASSPAP